MIINKSIYWKLETRLSTRVHVQWWRLVQRRRFRHRRGHHPRRNLVVQRFALGDRFDRVDVWRFRNRSCSITSRRRWMVIQILSRICNTTLRISAHISFPDMNGLLAVAAKPIQHSCKTRVRGVAVLYIFLNDNKVVEWAFKMWKVSTAPYSFTSVLRRW